MVVQNGDFGSRFGWYVDVIKRTVAQNWYSQLADPKASMGHSVIVTFVVHRDGSVSDPRIAQSSGVSSLDLSAIQAIQRVNTFGPLPPDTPEIQSPWPIPLLMIKVRGRDFFAAGL